MVFNSGWISMKSHFDRLW